MKASNNTNVNIGCQHATNILPIALGYEKICKHHNEKCNNTQFIINIHKFKRAQSTNCTNCNNIYNPFSDTHWTRYIQISTHRSTQLVQDNGRILHDMDGADNEANISI